MLLAPSSVPTKHSSSALKRTVMLFTINVTGEDTNVVNDRGRAEDYVDT
jgi:hypothetical protein